MYCFINDCTINFENGISSSKRCSCGTTFLLRDFRPPTSLGFHLTVNLIVLARFTHCLHIVNPQQRSNEHSLAVTCLVPADVIKFDIKHAKGNCKVGEQLSYEFFSSSMELTIYI